MSEADVWCDFKCYPENKDEAYYVEDNSGRIDTDNEGNEYKITKHHWRCEKCDKVVQYG